MVGTFSIQKALIYSFSHCPDKARMWCANTINTFGSHSTPEFAENNAKSVNSHCYRVLVLTLGKWMCAIYRAICSSLFLNGWSFPINGAYLQIWLTLSKWKFANLNYSFSFVNFCEWRRYSVGDRFFSGFNFSFYSV